MCIEHLQLSKEGVGDDDARGRLANEPITAYNIER